MKWLQYISTSFSTFGRNKMRTLLTTLSIAIGIAGVIGMMSIGAGAKKILISEVDRFGGPTMFGVYREEFIRKGRRWIRNPNQEFLTMHDVETIQMDCPLVDLATPQVEDDATISVGGNQKISRLQATTRDFQLLMRMKMEYGRFISDEDLSFWNKICVIGEAVAKDLFSGLNPIGKELKINNNRFTIVGVMANRESGMNPENDQNNQIFVPITAAQSRFLGHDHIGHILIRAKDYDSIDHAVNEVKTVLMRNHGVDHPFRVWVMKEELKSANRIILIIEAILVVIASVSLVVGGIGILNIMLVSVVERIPEIGLRKAVGAKKRDIRIQFLLESATICLIGSLIGILIGVGVGEIFSFAVSKYFVKVFEWPSIVTIESMLTAVLAGASVGIFFGYYPASRAAKLTPIEALRHKNF